MLEFNDFIAIFLIHLSMLLYLSNIKENEAFSYCLRNLLLNIIHKN